LNRFYRQGGLAAGIDDDPGVDVTADAGRISMRTPTARSPSNRT
jgi:hypothetical protein